MPKHCLVAFYFPLVSAMQSRLFIIVLAKCLHGSICFAYAIDLLIAYSNPDESKALLTRYFVIVAIRCLRQPRKCVFGKSCVIFLDEFVEIKEIEPAEYKLAQGSSLRAPECCQQYNNPNRSAPSHCSDTSIRIDSSEKSGSLGSIPSPWPTQPHAPLYFHHYPKVSSSGPHGPPYFYRYLKVPCSGKLVCQL